MNPRPALASRGGSRDFITGQGTSRAVQLRRRDSAAISPLGIAARLEAIRRLFQQDAPTGAQQRIGDATERRADQVSREFTGERRMTLDTFMAALPVLPEQVAAVAVTVLLGGSVEFEERPALIARFKSTDILPALDAWGLR